MDEIDTSAAEPPLFFYKGYHDRPSKIHNCCAAAHQFNLICVQWTARRI